MERDLMTHSFSESVSVNSIVQTIDDILANPLYPPVEINVFRRMIDAQKWIDS